MPSKSQGSNEILHSVYTVEKASPRYQGDTLPVLTVSMRYDQVTGLTTVRVRSQIDERPDMVVEVTRDAAGRTVPVQQKGEKQTGKKYCTWCGNVEAQDGPHCKHCGRKLVNNI